MQVKYVNMQAMYVNMQLIYGNMQPVFLSFLWRYCCNPLCKKIYFKGSRLTLKVKIFTLGLVFNP